MDKVESPIFASEVDLVIRLLGERVQSVSYSMQWGDRRQEVVISLAPPGRQSADSLVL